MFNPNEYLKEAIIERNMTRIYNEFYVIVHEDPGFNTGKFRDTLKFVKEQAIPNFMQPYDQRKFASKAEWNDDYWALVASSLLDNFSDDVINHLEQVGQHLYGQRVKQVNNPVASESHIRVTPPQSTSSKSVGGQSHSPYVRTTTTYGNSRGYTKKNVSKKIPPIGWLVVIALTTIVGIVVAIGGKTISIILAIILVITGGTLILRK